MNKVICDVCGTAYPETANQCPICGCAKVSSQTAAADADAQETTAYTYVKGGRFSKKNVRARNQKNKSQDMGKFRNQEPEDEEKTNKGLVAIVILLLIAIVGVVIYIGLQFFDIDLPGETTPSGESTAATQDSQTQDPQGSSDPTGGTSIPCTKLLLSNGTLEFLAVGDKWTLEVELEPVDCTEAVVFASADETIATVSQTGEVVAVGPGETVVTVTCGAVSAECKVLCSFPGASTPTEPSTPVDPNFTFQFNTKYVDDYTGYFDITLEQGDTWRAYTNDLSVAPEDITWVTDNPEICTIENGKVTITATGNTKVVSTLIHAQYGGQTFTCTVRVKPGEASDPTEGDATDSSEPKLYHTSSDDMTLKIDGYWWLRLQDSSDNTVEGVTWTADHEGYVKIEGNKLTGVKSTSDLPKKYVIVSCTYEGETYSCIVRVSGT